MIYTSVGVTSAFVFEQGFEFPTFKLSKTKRTVPLFHNVVALPEALLLNKAYAKIMFFSISQHHFLQKYMFLMTFVHS